MGIVLFLVLFGIYGLSQTRAISIDVATSYVGSWQLGTNGSRWIEHLNVLSDDSRRLGWINVNGTHEVIARSPGTIVATLPAYWLYGALGGTELVFWPAALTAAAMTAGAGVLLFLALSSVLTRRSALIATGVFALSTPVWPVAGAAMWPHTPTVFAIAGMAYASSRGRWWLVGVFGGIALWGRLHAAFIVAILGVLEAVRQRKPSIMLKVAATSLPFLVLFLVWTRWMYGEWRLTGGYPTTWFGSARGTFGNVLLNELGLFFSLGRGIVWWTPLSVVLAPAVLRKWKELPSWSTSLFVGGFAYTMIQGALVRFQGGDTFWAYRLGLELVTCAAPAYAMSVDRAGPVAKRVLPAVITYQVIMMIFGVVSQDGSPQPTVAWWAHPLVQLTVTTPLLGITMLGALAMLSVLIPRVVMRWRWVAPRQEGAGGIVPAGSEQAGEPDPSGRGAHVV